MRFRKGSQVEVFSNDTAPYGAWRCAEIISGNGRTYSVRFDYFPLAKDENIVDKVPRKNIRPCPPQIDVERWESGDLVEVLDDFSWKIATVLKGLGGKYYLVRLLGFPAEFAVNKVRIRVRQSWEDDTWFLTGKVSRSFKPSSTQAGSDVYQKPWTLSNNSVFPVPDVTSARKFGRMSHYGCSDCAESWTGNPRKIRSIEKEGQQYWFSSVKKVDDVACPPEIVDSINEQASLKKHKIGCCEMVRLRSNGYNECVRAGITEANGCNDNEDACSVGSCSAISYSESNMPTCMPDGAWPDEADSASSDAKSSCGSRKEIQNHIAGDGKAARSHRCELYSYCSILGELYASGPLSWDQEASLTDLRCSLNISDDEHLMELKNLISSGARNLKC